MNRILAIIFSLIVSLPLVGCMVQKKPPLSDDSSMSAASETSNRLQGEAKDCFYLVEESAENLISVQVPIVTTANALEINRCIKEQVYNELQNWLLPDKCSLKESETSISNIDKRMEPSEYSTQYLHISGKITFKNDTLVSLVFTGNQNVKSAAHPNEVFFTINVDVHTAQRVSLADVCAIDDSLYTAFLTHVNSERISRDELLSLKAFEKEVFLEGLAQEPENGFYGYFKPNYVCISYPVAYALGNHIEAEIPCKEVKIIE